MPLVTNDIASVAISALMRNAVATTPLPTPTASPIATPAAIAGAGEPCWASFAAVTPASA